MVLLCKFGQNPPFVSGDKSADKANWKLGQGHQNLIKSFNHPNVTIYEVWPEFIIWFKRQGADKLFLVNIWKFQSLLNWKLGQGHQNLIKSLNHPKVIIHEK